MEHKILQYSDGRYFVDIDISVEEWEEMLQNGNVFVPEALKMILCWYDEEDHQATAKTMMHKYCPLLNGTPYNGIVKGLSRKVLNHLENRFWVEDSKQTGRTSYWCIPFEGWHEDYNPKNHFIWKLRKELIAAIRILMDKGVINHSRSINHIEDELTTSVQVCSKEGKKIAYYTTKYERNSRNRDIAIQNKLNSGKSLCCEACGFDFEEIYGERGHQFIEVHHNKPLFSLDREQLIDPLNDLNCLCSNCHRMIHRNKSEILTVAELKSLIERNRKSKVGLEKANRTD